MKILNEQGYRFDQEGEYPPAESTGAMSIAGLIEYYRTHSVGTDTQVIPVITGSNINEVALKMILNS
jgi:threonine dehydratase